MTLLPVTDLRVAGEEVAVGWIPTLNAAPYPPAFVSKIRYHLTVIS